MNAARLAADLGRELDRADTSELWRAGLLYRWSPVCERFVETFQRVTIRPGQSLLSLEWQHEGVLATFDF
jgi:hypothetical protein